MSVPRVLVVQHTERGGPRRFGGWLADAGLALDVVPAYDGAELPDRLVHDAIVVLGGGFLPDDDARAPWLAQTRHLVGQAVDHSVPMFGICLGGQLLAQVAGGAVVADAGRPEVGSTPITLRPEAADDPLFHGLPAEVTAVENHVDEISRLPDGAHWLAFSERCPHQAFRVGDRAWGVQFHPEVDAADLADWRPERLARRGVDAAEVYRQALADEPAAAPVWREVAHRFAAVVRSGDGG